MRLFDRVLMRQYSGQKLSNHIINGAVVTQLLIDGTAFLSSARSGYMVYTSVDEVLIALTPFETRHSERRLGPVGRLASLQLRDAPSAQTGLQMTSSRAGRARLTIAQARELFGLAEKTFALETRFVITVDRLG